MNNESYDLLNENEKELFLKQLDILLIADQGGLVKDIHIFKEDGFTTLEWETVPTERDWGGKFVFLQEDEVVMKQVRFPDDHYEYIFEDEVDEKLKKWHEDHPEWTVTPSGTWTNVEENRRFSIEHCALKWRETETAITNAIFTESIFEFNPNREGEFLAALCSPDKYILTRTEYIVISPETYALLTNGTKALADVEDIIKLDDPLECCDDDNNILKIWIYVTSYVDDNRVYYIGDTSLLIHRTVIEETQDE